MFVKVYILCETKIDYLEIWDYINIVGVFNSKELANAKAIELKLNEYKIIMKKVQND